MKILSFGETNKMKSFCRQNILATFYLNFYVFFVLFKISVHSKMPISNWLCVLAYRRYDDCTPHLTGGAVECGADASRWWRFGDAPVVT